MKFYDIVSSVKMKLKKLTETSTIPTYGSLKAAGMDLYADITQPMEIMPGETKMIPSNICVQLPENTVGLVFPRSGLSTRQGLRLANCVGVIDEDYRGAIGMPTHNDSMIPQTIIPGERVAQMIVIPYIRIDEFIVVDELDDTERGVNGFGSTGKT